VRTTFHLKKRSIFALAFLLGLAPVLVESFLHRPHDSLEKKPLPLTDNVYVTEQLKREDIFAVSKEGFKTLIDIRPDGEVPDEIPSSDAGRIAVQTGLKFAYVPVPHGPIPASAVTALSDALAGKPRPVLLYCHSGRRAARTFSLVEASRPGGLDAAHILAMVKAAGQSADDLSAEINDRIAHRSAQAGAHP